MAASQQKIRLQYFKKAESNRSFSHKKIRYSSITGALDQTNVDISWIRKQIN
jgi:hypothetical protein